MSTSCRSRVLVVAGRHGVSTNQREGVADTRPGPPRTRRSPGRIPSSTDPHMPGTRCSSVPRTMWQVEVPMIITIRPGLVTVAAGTATCASTLPMATAVPGRSPVHPAASSVKPPARSATRSDVARQLRVDDVGEARVEGGEEVRIREPVALRPHRLVPGGARIPRLDAGQAPDDPVGRLDEAVGRVVDGSGASSRTWRTLEKNHSDEILPAVPVQPGLAGRPGGGVDPVRLGLRGVVLPELDPGMGLRPPGAGPRRQGRAVGQGRQHRAGRDVDAQADDRVRVDAAVREQGGHGLAEDVEVVGRRPGAPSRAAARRSRSSGGSASSITPWG